MMDIIVKIMVELLSVFALATRQVKQGRFKKFAKKLRERGRGCAAHTRRMTNADAKINERYPVKFLTDQENGISGDTRHLTKDKRIHAY